MREVYFTGKPCKHGHIAPRLAISNSCMECQRAFDRSPSRAKPRYKDLEYIKKYQRVNKPHNNQYIRDRRAAIQEWLWEFKLTLSCNRCGFSHPAALQFHHVSKDKEIGVARAAHQSKTKAMAEIAKCEVLCANCHCIEHHPKSSRLGAKN